MARRRLRSLIDHLTHPLIAFPALVLASWILMGTIVRLDPHFAAGAAGARAEFARHVRLCRWCRDRYGSDPERWPAGVIDGAQAYPCVLRFGRPAASRQGTQ